ncbi:MAG TPA: outer membrane beta-barrel protein [Candidatus Polarisedimenticolia bacterium]|nr:outer membrane beta-barrel protein [Candidatus Polarisedimenticolia bacterium]
MRQSLTVVPMALLALILGIAPAAAINQPGDYAFTTNIGLSNARSDNAYSSDQTVSFSVEYQRTGSAAYRASAGFLTIAGRKDISPAAGPRDADAMFVTGNIVFTPRFAVVHPYITAGLGLYSLRLTDRVTNEQNVELGLNWGFGMDVQIVRHFAIRGEAIFHYTTGNIANPIQALTVGGRFDF